MYNPYLSPYGDTGIVHPVRRAKYRLFVRIGTFLVLLGWAAILFYESACAGVRDFPGIQDVLPAAKAFLLGGTVPPVYVICMTLVSVLFLAILVTTPTKTTDYNRVFANDDFRPEKRWPPIPVREKLVYFRTVAGIATCVCGTVWFAANILASIQEIPQTFQPWSLAIHTYMLIPSLCVGITLLRLDRMPAGIRGTILPVSGFSPAGARECIEFRKSMHAFQDTRIQILNTVTVLCIWVGSVYLSPDLALLYTGSHTHSLRLLFTPRHGFHPLLGLSFLLIAFFAAQDAKSRRSAIMAADREDVFVLRGLTVRNHGGQQKAGTLAWFPYHVTDISDTESETRLRYVPIACAFMKTFRCLRLPENVPVLLFLAGDRIEVFAFQHISYVPVLQPICMILVRRQLLADHA